MLLLTAALATMQGATGHSSPPGGDTVGYWQQNIAYTIAATLDEREQKVRARGALRYVNNSPDTLRVMYLHQYLNAFRPASRWSRRDEREGRERFQRLGGGRDPDYAYERFTAPVRVDGSVVPVVYPGAPDSTVVRIALPRSLAPGDSVVVELEWEARPSTLPRRQGRRGRHWDMAQWYPKVAVYDRGGWQENALQPAGEFYGEFGTYDVTLVVAADQVIGATGVPVSGDPGWSRATREGFARLAANAYGPLPRGPAPNVPPGHKAVRFVARGVHHFAWSASPDYRYEGGVLVRELPGARWPVWDTVSIHVLYRPGDDTTWGGLRVVRRTISALQWLEAIYGPYAYPQMTVLHRLEGGGTEFPMMQMNASPSQGLILHEGGHVFTYGILANNEWRSGWMDEGLTSYQTAWAQLLTPQERVRAGIVDQPRDVPGYGGRAIRMTLPRFESLAVQQTFMDLEGAAQPIGMVAHEFQDFSTYGQMIYNRAEVMYGQLRDVLGDSLFLAFLRDYYARWALKHVDERAMRASAERVSGRDLDWFFDQWVHGTGVMDYSLTRVRRSRDSSGAWVTQATVRRRGEYSHPMNVGVRTAAGWTLARMTDPLADREVVRVVTTDEPLEVRLDPHHVTWDWDRRNDVQQRGPWHARFGIDWPFLAQADRDRDLVLLRPAAWYSDQGGATVGLRVRGNYLGWIDGFQGGIANATRSGLDSRDRLQFWEQGENPTLLFMSRPAIGWRFGAASLDDVTRATIGRRRESAVARTQALSDFTLTYSNTNGRELLPELWEERWTADLGAHGRLQVATMDGGHRFVHSWIVLGAAEGPRASGDANGYAKLEVATGRLRRFENGHVAWRLYLGQLISDDLRRTPGQRALLVSAMDPLSTFDNHWWRPPGAILKRPGVSWLPLGGAALRGYDWVVRAAEISATNVELSRALGETSDQRTPLTLSLSVFGDAAIARLDPAESRRDWLSDAGVGLALRGRLYDQPIHVRLDVPVFVSRPELAIDRGRGGRGRIAPRWVLTFNDIW